MSMRLAIKRSMEVSAEQPSATENQSSAAADSNIDIETMAKKDRPPTSSRRGKQRRTIPVIHVELPKIDKCIRNDDPSKIDEFGFVEFSGALSDRLIEQLHEEAVEKVARHRRTAAASANNDSPSSNKRKKHQQQQHHQQQQSEAEVEEISNALQVDVSDELLQRMNYSMESCVTAKQTMQAVFGKPGSFKNYHHHVGDSDDANNDNNKSNYDGFVVETPKVLVTHPGSNPQLPHADDHCTSCIIGLMHLHDNQEPTRVARYDGSTKDYPTGITVACDDCNRMEQLPDSDYRRGVHLTDEKWHCDNCKSPHTPYDFEGKLTHSFGELLEEHAPNLCDGYCGKKTTRAGDGILGLPTLIHRGPGNPTSSKQSRYMLFFTLRPLYKNNNQRTGISDASGTMYHKYNPALQIHASCILFNQFKKVKKIYERSGCGLENYFEALVGSDAASLMNENVRLKEENKLLRLKVLSASASKKKKRSRSNGNGNDDDYVEEGLTIAQLKRVSPQKKLELSAGDLVPWNCHTCGKNNTNKKRCGHCRSGKGGKRPNVVEKTLWKGSSDSRPDIMVKSELN